MEEGTHGDTQNGDGYSQDCHLAQGQNIHTQGGFQQDTLGMDAKEQAHPAGDEGRQETGQQRRREHGAHGLELHAEQGRGQRSSEEAGEDRRHAAHDHHLPLLQIQLEDLGKEGCGRAAQLQRSALTARRTAEKMGGGSCKEDTGEHRRRHRMTVQGSVDDLVGALVVLKLQKLVQAHSEQTAHRQQIDQPGIFSTDMGHKMQGMMESGADETA